MKPSTTTIVAYVTFATVLALGMEQALGATQLADQPLSGSKLAPANVAVVMSVEYPTAVNAAYSRTYDNTVTFDGYFDPAKCYSYHYDSSDTPSSSSTTPASFFIASSIAGSNHTCNNQWSGSFLNWASMQTIDGFRWAATGGYRILDTAAIGTAPSLTVLEKGFASGQNGARMFPDSSVPIAMIAGATPFGSANAPAMYMRIQGLGNRLRFVLTSSEPYYTGKFYNTTDLSGSVVATKTAAGTDFITPGVAPATGVNTSKYSVRLTGTAIAPLTGNYTFTVDADDGAALTINGTLVVNHFSDTSAQRTMTSAIVALTAGTGINIVLDFAQKSNKAGLKLRWKIPGTSVFVNLPNWAELYSTTMSNYPGEGTTIAMDKAYELFVRAKVCDASAPSLESNCKKYGSGYKPEGLLQTNSSDVRFSALSYLNDSDPARDGGVLRAQQKFIGPMQAIVGGASASNPSSEWDQSTGVRMRNPDAFDASATGVYDSGVLNYIDKFGEILRTGYKTYDPISELYYAATRYYKHLGNVPQWSDLSNLSASARTTAIDGFPIITDWADPIQYACQKNAIIMIGDVNAQRDKNVPGNTMFAYEPSLPPAVSADPSPVTPYQALAQISAMEGGFPASWGTTLAWAADTSSVGTTGAIAGLAYDNHTSDIRPDLASSPQTLGTQTIDSYFVDVQEQAAYIASNQFWLAAKYGGFQVPSGYLPYASSTPLADSWWWNGVDYASSYPPGTTQKKPNTYFAGNRPELLRIGLASAFAAVQATIRGNSTGFSTPLPQISSSGTGNYAASYDPSSWTSDLTGSVLGGTATASGGNVGTSAPVWSFATKLAAQATGAGWSTARRIATWNGTRGVQFTTTAITPSASTTLSAAQLAALDTSYVSGNDSEDYLAYLRGDRTHEQSASTVDATHVYRQRAALLGDIINSKPTAVGPPSFPYSDDANPGYSAFKAAWANRRTVVYAGAQDGMLHAINGALSTSPSSGLEYDTAAGTELFAYVPSALFQGPNATPNIDGLASIGNPAYVHHYMVDQPPQVFDVDFSKTLGASGSADWHSILVGGLGKGGSSYYAIDVTNPAGIGTGGESTLASKVLWEFTSPMLGYSFGEPMAVKLKKYGWVVVVPSGYNASDNFGRLFVINPKSGSLIETIVTTSASSGLAHVNAYLPDVTDGTAESLYASDLDGQLWRVDVTGTSATTSYPSPVNIATVTDATGVAQPITSRPIVQIDPASGQRFVMFGTGRLLAQSDIGSTQVQSFYAIIDGSAAIPASKPKSGNTFPVTRTLLTDNATPLTGISAGIATSSGWFEDMPAGYEVTSDSTAVYSTVAWAATTIPSNDACGGSGYSLIYARNFATGKTMLLKGEAPVVSLTTSDISGGTPSVVTDLGFVGYNGSATLLFGQGNMVGVQTAATAPLLNPTMRRINWRELPSNN